MTFVAKIVVRHRVTGGSMWTYDTVAPGSAVTLTDLERGVTYEIEAKTVSPRGTSSIWVPVTHTIANADQIPAAPINLVGVGQADGVHLAWQLASLAGAQIRYNVDYAPNLPNNTPGTWLTYSAGLQTQQATVPVTDGSTNWFRVWAQSWAGVPSAYSNAVSVKAKAVQDGADITGQNTSANSNQLGGVPAATINSQISSALSTASNAAVTYYQSSAPPATHKGDIWFQTSNGNAAYVSDGAGNWQVAQDSSIAAAASAAVSAQITANGKITSYYQSTAPAATHNGDIWFDTSNGNKASVSDGAGHWISAQDSAIVTAINNAANAQSTANGKVTTFFQSTQPTALAVGDLWFNTTTSKLYRWDGSTWNSSVGDVTQANPQGSTWLTDTGVVVRGGDPITRLSSVNQDNVPSGTTYGRILNTLIQGPGVVNLGTGVGKQALSNWTFSSNLVNTAIGTALSPNGTCSDGWGVVTVNSGMSVIYEKSSASTDVLLRLLSTAVVPANTTIVCNVKTTARYPIAAGQAYVITGRVQMNSQTSSTPAGFALNPYVVIEFFRGDGSASAVQTGNSATIAFVNNTVGSIILTGNAPSDAVSCDVYFQLNVANTTSAAINPGGQLISDCRYQSISLVFPSNIDSEVFDGTTYGRPLLGRLNAGRPLIDLSETIHLNKVSTSLNDTSSLARAADPITRFSGLVATNFTYTGGATVDSLKPNQAGADNTASNHQPSTWTTDSSSLARAGDAITRFAGLLATNFTYASGSTIESLKPATAGATAGAPSGTLINGVACEIVAAATTPNANLVVNSSFALGVRNWTAGGGWANATANGQPSALLLIGTTAQTSVLQSQNITVVGSSYYSYSMDMLLTGNLNSGDVSADILWYDSSGTNIAESNRLFIVSSNNGGFTRYFLNGAVSPATAVNAQLRVFSEAASVASGSCGIFARRIKLELGQLCTPYADDATQGGNQLTNPSSGARLGNLSNMQQRTVTNFSAKVPTTVNYSASTTSATISVPAFTILAGSISIGYNAMSVGVSGTAGTSPTYYLYVNDAAWIGGTQTLVATTNPSAIYSGDGFVYIGAVVVSFPTSGTGSGGGNSGGPNSCVCAHMFVNGPMRSIDAVPGDWFDCLDIPSRGMEHFRRRLIARELATVPCVRITTDKGAILDCSDTTPFDLIGGGMLWAPDMLGEKVVTDWGIETVIEVKSIGDQLVTHNHFGGVSYAAGADAAHRIYSHNVIAKP